MKSSNRFAVVGKSHRGGFHTRRRIGRGSGLPGKQVERDQLPRHFVLRTYRSSSSRRGTSAARFEDRPAIPVGKFPAAPPHPAVSRSSIGRNRNTVAGTGQLDTGGPARVPAQDMGV